MAGSPRWRRTTSTGSAATLGSARVAADAGEAVGEDAAAEVGAEVVLHPAQHALAVGIRRGGVGQERLQRLSETLRRVRG